MIEWRPRVLARDLAAPEGPVVLDDGSVALAEMRAGRVTAIRPDGSSTVLAEMGGAPNGLTLGADGSIYVANNGGVHLGPDGYWLADDLGDGSVQHIAPDGAVSTLAGSFPDDEPHRPNDLCFGPDGALYVTDPANWEDLANLKPGRLWLVALDGATRKVAEISWFPNGIAVGPDGRLFVAQSVTQHLLVVADDGTTSVFATMPTGAPDGFCFTADGALIVTGSLGNVVCVFGPDGSLLQAIETGEGSDPTNCCLAEGVLYVTMSGSGELLAVDVPFGPLALFRG